MEDKDQPQVHEIIYTHDTIASVAQELTTCMSYAQVMTFRGALGAGKTTLIQSILEASGVSDPAPSPTYSYVHTYTTRRGETIYHFDLYRISSIEEFCDAGFHDYLYAPGSWALIEWPEVIMDLLDRNVCHITISHYGYERRRVRYMCI